MTDRDNSEMSLNTTAGFRHHKLKVCVQSPKSFPKNTKQDMCNLVGKRMQKDWLILQRFQCIKFSISILRFIGIINMIGDQNSL